MVDVTISLVGANGDTILLSDDGDFILTTGVGGFGIPSTAVRIDSSAGDGGTWRHSKRGVRDVDLPIVILGSDRADVETKLRRLARLLQDRTGAPKIVANYSDGSSVYLEAHYVGGAETQFGKDAGLYFCKWVIQMQAPQPYWIAGQTQSFTITSGNTGRGLLPGLAKLKVSSSQSLGLVSVNSTADVDVYPVWTIRGPITGLSISNGTQSFSLTDPIAVGETLTVDTANATVTSSNGSNGYALLGASPKFFAFPPGITTVEVNGIDTNANTYISCNYALRYEVIH